MFAYIFIENKSEYKTVSVYAGDVLVAKDLLGLSQKTEIPSGSMTVKVLDNREKLIFDLYLPVYPKRVYLLELLKKGYRFRPIGFF